MNPYLIQLEISGPTALWTRPDTGSSPVSYVAPTFSAAKGIFESILRWKSVNVRPTRVEVCRPVQFHRYTTNYGGPLRASDVFAKGASFQFYAVVLVNVCYHLYAEVEAAGHHETTNWPPHAYHDVFKRALERDTSPPRKGRGQGEVWNLVSCGNGPVPVRNASCEPENHELPTMLRMVSDQQQSISAN